MRKLTTETTEMRTKCESLVYGNDGKFIPEGRKKEAVAID